jgi:hypothetical protein
MADEFEGFACLRAKEQAEETPSGRFEHPEVLSFSRARAIALNRSHATAKESLHLETCHRCAYLVQSFERYIQHPPLWELLCHVLGRLSAETGCIVAKHLEEDQCKQCLRRREVLRAGIDRVVQFLEPLTLPNPASLRAKDAVASFDRRFGSRAACGLEGRLVQRGDTMQLLVRTKDAALQDYWLSYSLHGEPGSEPITGLTVFRADINDWWAALTEFALSELQRRLKGQCKAVMLCPVKVDWLTRSDYQSLASSVLRCPFVEDKNRLREVMELLQP